MMISSEPAAVAAGEEVNHSQQQQVAMIVPETCAEGTHCQKEQNSIGDLQGLEFICDHEGYRYYKNRETGKQCALDSLGYWYVFDEQSGAFTPLNAVQSTEDQNEEKKTKSNQVDHKLKNAEKYGITFDHNGHPCYPKNEKGLFVLPKDDKGLPFFPVDDRGRPIFPYNYSKDESTFPVDDTEEPIFPRNELNKPLVPTDKNGEPIFPIDADGNYIFPFDENNCPIPALTADGKSVLPKDVYGNFVIPQDREGKPLIHIASDGVTPISIAEWKQWKTYYREQTRNFYQQQQQQTQQIGTEGANANYQQANSMFHPLNLEQQSVYFAADMEMLQMTRRVRPEDVDLPNMQAQVNSQSQSAVAAATETTNSTSAVKDNVNGTAGFDPKQPKRNKFLEAQLKSVKKVIPPPQAKTEEVKKVEKRQEKDIEKETDKKRYFPAKKDYRKRPADRRSRDRSPKRSRRRSSSRSSYSSRSVKRRNRSGRRDRRHRARSPSYSSSSSSSYTTSSRSRTSTPLSSSRENRQRDRVKEEEEETIRSRIISRAMTTSASAPDSVHSQAQIDNDLGPEEYGPKPPAQLGNGGSDMELSEGEEETKTAEAEKEVEAEATEYEELGIGINKREATVDTAKEMEQKAQEENEVKAGVKSTAVEGSYNVKEVLKSESLELIRLCKVQEKEKYDQVKLLIAELEVERSVHKRNWAQLREAERRLERKTGTDNLSSSDDS